MEPFPKIYPITDRLLSGRSHLEQCKEMIRGGAAIIQLRDKTARSDELYRAAKEVCEFASGFGVRIIINDRADIALAAAASGVHLGQDDLPPRAARDLLGPDAIIGFSTHDLRQAAEAASLPVDYIAIGPVFATPTKENPDPEVGIEGVRIVREATRGVTLVAIGGITSANYRDVIAAGADSVAVISDILAGDEIAEKVAAFLD